MCVFVLLELFEFVKQSASLDFEHKRVLTFCDWEHLSGLECVVDALERNEKYSGIGLLKSIVRGSEVSKLVDS